ncbi:hypothetical protein [Burkholderia sp. PU8-34]
MAEAAHRDLNGTRARSLSIAEAANALQCDEAYLELILRKANVKLQRDVSGAESVGLDVIVDLRRQCWQEIRRIVMTVLDAFEDESIDWILKEAQTKLASRDRPRASAKSGKRPSA